MTRPSPPRRGRDAASSGAASASILLTLIALSTLRGPGPGHGPTPVGADMNPNPLPYNPILPDGSISKVNVYLKGDPEYSWEEDPDGYTLTTDADGYKAYAIRNPKTGKKEPTKCRPDDGCSAEKMGVSVKKHEKDSVRVRNKECDEGRGRFCRRKKGVGVNAALKRAGEKRRRKGGGGGGGGAGAGAGAGGRKRNKRGRGDEDEEEEDARRLALHPSSGGGAGMPALRGGRLIAPPPLPSGDSSPPNGDRLLQDDDGATVMKNIVVMIRFADHKDRVLPTRTDFESLFNDPDCSSPLCPTGSVRDVFLFNSYGLLDLTSVVYDWVDVDGTEAYYGDGYYGCTGRFTEAIRQALDYIDDHVVDHTGGGGTGVDFAQFDNDGDGKVDAITVLHSGYGSEWGGVDCETQNDHVNRIWSHKWNLNRNFGGRWYSKEGPSIFEYHVSPGIWGTCGSEIGRIGVITHETAHFLGMPDLYDGSGGTGVGSWCLMGNSWGFDGSQLYPPMLNAWGKFTLGWLDPILLSTSGAFSLRPSHTYPDVYMISAGYADKEYLLIENRQKHPRMCDKHVPQGGLIVWHIDDDANWSTEGHPGQDGWPANGNHYRVALLAADGNYDLEQGRGYGDAGDVFRSGGVNEIGPHGVGTCSGCHPTTDSYKGGNIVQTGHRVHGVGPSGDNMSFQFEMGGTGVEGTPEPTSEPSPGPTAAPAVDPVTAAPVVAPTSGPTSSPSLPDPQIYIEKPQYQSGESVMVTFENPAPKDDDWVAIYDSGAEMNGKVPQGVKDWKFTCGDVSCRGERRSGTGVFDRALEPGTYQAFLLLNSYPPYTVKASSDVFTVVQGPTEAPTSAPVVAPTVAPVTAAPVTAAPVTAAPVTEAPATSTPVAASTPRPTEAPVASVTVESEGVCESWCDGADMSWNKKCSWMDCKDCGPCDGVELPCRGWCHRFAAKCDWLLYCGGCPDCGTAGMSMSVGMAMGRSRDRDVDDGPSSLWLNTTLEGGLRNDGVMFDVEAHTLVEITSFSALCSGGSTGAVTAKVFTKPGSYAGHEGDRGSWTEVCRSSVECAGPAETTLIDDEDCSPMEMNQYDVRAFYVYLEGGASLHYTEESYEEGTVFAQNSDLSVMVGRGVADEFGPTSERRRFNGGINYIAFGAKHANAAIYPLGADAKAVASADDPVDGTVGSS